jgi:tetratricopeptide (TPR) repeat protein
VAKSEAYLGDIALKGQENDQARALSKHALRLFPDIRIAHYDLGVLASEEGNYAEAAAELKEAIRLDPKEADEHFRLMQVYRKPGKGKAGSSRAERVSEIQQKTGEHLYKRAFRTGSSSGSLEPVLRDRAAAVHPHLSRTGGCRQA